MPMWRHVVARARRPTERRRAVVPNIPKKKSHPLCTAHGAYPLFAAAYVLRPVSKWKELERCYGQIAQFATGRNDVKLTTIILKSTAEDELFTKKPSSFEDFIICASGCPPKIRLWWSSGGTRRRVDGLPYMPPFGATDNNRTMGLRGMM